MEPGNEAGSGVSNLITKILEFETLVKGSECSTTMVYSCIETGMHVHTHTCCIGCYCFHSASIVSTGARKVRCFSVRSQYSLHRGSAECILAE